MANFSEVAMWSDITMIKGFLKEVVNLTGLWLYVAMEDFPNESNSLQIAFRPPAAEALNPMVMNSSLSCIKMGGNKHLAACTCTKGAS
jgi:hypothetical protein